MRDENERDVGEIFLSDEFLSIKSGIGISEYGFGNQIVSSRLFTGIIHYSHNAKCTDSSSQATTLYSFYTQVNNKESIDEIRYMLDYSLANILSSSLSTFRDEFKIVVESTTCAESTLEKECDNDKTEITSCTVVDCQLAVNHLSTISQGNLQYMLLQQAMNVTEWMNQDKIEVEYAGMETLLASILIKLEGIPDSSISTMNDEQKHYIEDIITSFLEEKTMSQSNARVLGTNITSQRGSDESYRDDNRILKQTNWIELSVDVFAAFTPPYTGSIQFDMIVISSFRSQGSDFIYDISTRHYLPGSIVEGKYGNFFEGITQIMVTSPTSPVQNVTNGGAHNETSGNLTSSFYGLDNFIFVGICCIVIFFMCVWMCICTQGSKSEDMEGDGIILIDSTGKRRNRSSVLFMNTDRSSSKNKEHRIVGEAVITNDNALMPPVQSRSLHDKSSHALPRHEFSKASNSGMHGSNDNSNLNVKSSHRSQGPRMDHGQMIRKHSRERLGNVSNHVKHGSTHSHSPDIQSTYDSGMHGSNHSSNLNPKSSHGSRGPMMDHGRIVRKHSREPLGHESNFVKNRSNHSHSHYIQSTYDSGSNGSTHSSNLNAKSSHGSRGPKMENGRIIRKHSREPSGHVSNVVRHSSKHSRSLDVKSTHASRLP